MTQIGGTRQKTKQKNSNWVEDAREDFELAMKPSLEYIFRVEYGRDGEPLRGRTNSFVKVLINSGPRDSGKSSFANAFIEDMEQTYGEENVGIQVGFDMLSMLGKWDEKTASWTGGSLGDEFIQIIVIEDALTYLGAEKSPSEISEVTKVFENARHRLTSFDEYDNKVGGVYFVLNIQGYSLLHDAVRRYWDFLLIRSIPSNKFHRNEMKRDMPAEAIALLQSFRAKMKFNAVDMSYKGTCVVDYGDGKTFGKLKTERAQTPYTKKGGDYWVTPLTDANNDGNRSSVTIENNTYQPMKPRTNTGKEYEFTEIDRFPLGVELLERAFEYGWDDPFPIGDNSKYRPDVHWEASKLYLVDGWSTSMIAERFGVTDQMITNGYNQGGYIAITIQEQIGHWFEKIIKDLPSSVSIDWEVIAGNRESDLWCPEAVAANGKPGVGIHGEVKTKRRKRSPSDKWISGGMADHIQAGGIAYAYQVILRRDTSGSIAHEVYVYEVKLIGYEDETDENTTEEVTNTASDILVVRPKQRSSSII